MDHFFRYKKNFDCHVTSPTTRSISTNNPALQSFISLPGADTHLLFGTTRETEP